MESLLKEDNYYVVQSYMVKELHLKGTELVIYAIIKGFSQTEGQNFTGSLRYLEEWTNSSKKSVISNLKSLCEKGLIEKIEIMRNGVKFCEYKTLPEVKKVYQGGDETSPVVKKLHQGGVKSSPGGGVKISPNNKDIYNKAYNKEEKEIYKEKVENGEQDPDERLLEKRKEEKHKYGEYKHILLTDKELSKLKDDFGEKNTKNAIKMLDEAIEVKGYSYKNHNLVIRGWVQRSMREKGIWEKAPPKKIEVEVEKPVLSEEEEKEFNEFMKNKGLNLNCLKGF